jgi:hypothetical protein
MASIFSFSGLWNVCLTFVRLTKPATLATTSVCFSGQELAEKEDEAGEAGAGEGHGTSG